MRSCYFGASEKCLRPAGSERLELSRGRKATPWLPSKDPPGQEIRVTGRNQMPQNSLAHGASHYSVYNHGMTRFAVLVALVLVATLGCGKSEKESDPVVEAPSVQATPTVSRRATSSSDLETQVTDLKASLDELRGEIDHLKSESSNFSDGLTNWKDVVPDVEAATKKVDDAMDDVETKASTLESDSLGSKIETVVGELKTSLGELRDEIDRLKREVDGFGYSSPDWKSVVSDVEDAVKRVDGAMDEVETKASGVDVPDPDPSE